MKKIVTILILLLMSLVLIGQERELSDYEKYRMQKEADMLAETPKDTIHDTIYIEKQESDKYIKQEQYPVDYAISAFWMLKREAMEKVGLLDENIFYAPEDVDYCLRIWKAGYQIFYAPQIWSIHNAREISRGAKINSSTIKHLQGLLYYFRKHRYLFQSPQRAVPNRQKRNGYIGLG